MSFCQTPLINQDNRTFVGLSNFQRMVQDPLFFLCLKNTAIWTTLTVTVSFVGGMVVALMLNSVQRGRGVCRALLLVPWLTPPVVAGLTWKVLYAKDYGLFNFILSRFGLAQGVDWLGDPAVAMFATSGVFAWRSLTFTTISLLAGLQAIPSDLLEAAQIDGVGPAQYLWCITLPLLRPIMMIVLILGTIWSVTHFDIVYIMTKGGPAHATQLLSTYVYTAAFTMDNLGYGSAIAVFMALIMVAPIAIFLRFFERA